MMGWCEITAQMSSEQPKYSSAGAEDAHSAEEPRSRAELVERLFREHNEALVRFLLPRLRSYQEAREVAQEAYVRLLSLDEPGAVSYLRAFLFKTAANLAVDRRRRDEVHARATELPLFHDFVDVRTPERRVAGEQAMQRLQRLIAAMPPKCRRAFVLHQFDGLDFASIAREMNISERMVRKYVVRALVQCRAQLGLKGVEP
jgi:RNA polymerase sigma-70 factor (ECF subfamily)